MYNAELGRFITRDPLGYVDGMSVYEYGLSNCVMTADPQGTVVVALSGAGEDEESFSPLMMSVAETLAFGITNVVNKEVTVDAVLAYDGPLIDSFVSAGYERNLRRHYEAFVKRKAADRCSVEQFVAVGHSSGASAIYNVVDDREFAEIAGDHVPAGDGRRFAPSFLGTVDMVYIHANLLTPEGNLAGSQLRNRVINVYQKEHPVLRGKPIKGVANHKFTKADSPKMGHWFIKDYGRTHSIMAMGALRWYLQDMQADAAWLRKQGLSPDFDHAF
jgi:hypothetical protein